jgi:fumarate reductase subunit D
MLGLELREDYGKGSRGLGMRRRVSDWVVVVSSLFILVLVVFGLLMGVHSLRHGLHGLLET